MGAFLPCPPFPVTFDDGTLIGLWGNVYRFLKLLVFFPTRI